MISLERACVRARVCVSVCVGARTHARACVLVRGCLCEAFCYSK